MLEQYKNFKKSVEKDPVIFTEDVYLCTKFGEILTGRYAVSRKIKNIFDVLDDSDVRFLRKSMSLPGFTPLAFVGSREGIIIFDLSLCPKFGLMIAIFPHFSREDILGLAASDLSYRAMISSNLILDINAYKNFTVSAKAKIFADRMLAVCRSGEYFSFLLKTNSEIFSAMSEIAKSLSVFYGSDLNVTFGKVSDDFELKNEFCFESYAFSIINLIFLARNYSATRNASLKICIDEMGVYFDFVFRIAEQYQNYELYNIAPELKNLSTVAADRIFNCFSVQKDGVFAFRGFPWLRLPDSADLKAKEEDFIYDC